MGFFHDEISSSSTPDAAASTLLLWWIQQACWMLPLPEDPEAASSCQWLTSLWSGGDNSAPGKQLNPQHPVPQQQHKPHHHRQDEEEDGRVHAGLASRSKHPQKSSVFQCTTRVEGVTELFSHKSDQQQEQVPSVCQAGCSPATVSSLLQLNCMSRWMLKSFAMMCSCCLMKQQKRLWSKAF